MLVGAVFVILLIIFALNTNHKNNKTIYANYKEQNI